MMSWWDSECNELLKSRKGLEYLILLAGDLPGCSVEDVVRFAHIDYNWPLNMLP